MFFLPGTHSIKFVAGFCKLGQRIVYFILLLGVIWPGVEAYSQAGSAISTATISGYSKSNQSKVFYHDGKWWAIAFNNPDSRWYIWKFSGGAWSKIRELNKSTTLKYDAAVNSATGKLYIMGSHASNSEFWRFTYSSGSSTWTKDSGFDVNPSFTNNDAANPVSLVQAKNGDLWIFRVASNKLEAKRSTDGGATWSAVITVKTGLTTATGTTDAVVFTASANNYIGVAYGETDAAGSKYGFLIHRDGDPDAVWTDESASLTFFGSERANNKISVTIDKNNNVYLFTQNAGASGAAPNNTLYKRSSAASGAWTKFVVNSNASGLNWKTPAIVADTSNNALYLMGVNVSTQFAEYKVCAIGAEANLNTAAAMIALSSAGASFDDLSLPAPFVSTASGLMICGDNLKANDIWYNQLALGPIGGSQPPATINSVSVSPNEANTAGSYTISLTLGDQGALSAGNGAITIQFPDNTLAPNNIAANQITVNGTAATTVASNSSAAEVTITTPINLENSANVTLAFNSGANILNPANAGNYSLQASTSVQTISASSPSYAISAAATTVSAATVTPSPTATSAAAAYMIAFNLGSHGRLLSGSTITVTFNNSTNVTGGSLSGVQVNGASAAAAGNSSNKAVVVTIPAALSLGNGAAVRVNLPASAITNPASAGNYTLTVATSVENTAITSNEYTVELVGPVSIGTVALSTNEANTNSSYSIPLTLGSNGALTAGNGTIAIKFPDNTSVPSSISASQITVNGVAASAATSNSGTREVIINNSADLANNANVSVVFHSGANLLNPSNAGNYILQAWTSAQPATASSPAYSISAAATSVSTPNVIPSPNTINNSAAYTIAFNLGSHGRLISGSSTITVTFNNSTNVTNGSLGGVQVNGANAAATGNSIGKTVTITVPVSVSLGNGAAVTMSLPSSAIVNPTSDGGYTLTVATSVETLPTASNAYSIVSLPTLPATGEDDPIPGTTGGYDKPHQNRPFYHAGIWWTTAKKSSDTKWYLWKLNGSSWSAELEIDDRKSTRPDCYVDSPANKLYILLASSSSTGTKILRLSYTNGGWSIDAGFPVLLSSFVFSSESGNVFTKAKNGELWVFRYKSSKVDGKRSSDDGLTWSAIFTVKSGLGSAGLADAVAFTSGGQNYVGVGYAENTSTSGKFGFLIHKDGDPDGSWTDETNAMPQFNNAQSDDHLSLAVGKNNEIFFVCKTHPNSSSAAGIGLLKRNTNGGWQNFTIQPGGGWTRPAVVVDETNNELYVFGAQEASPEYGQYKKCAIGNENSLKDAAPVNIFDDAGYNNFSVPQHRVTGETEMLVCVEKSSGNAIWYNLLPISNSGASSKFAAASELKPLSPEVFSLVAAYPNPFSAGRTTAIRFELNAPAPVSLQIFNLRGQLVNTIVERDLNAGIHEQHWNGRDHFGRIVASGVYFYRLRLGAELFRGRLQMVK